MDNLRLLTKTKKSSNTKIKRQLRRRVPRCVNFKNLTVVPGAYVAPSVQPPRVTRQQTKKIEMKRNPVRKSRMPRRTLVEVSPTTTDNSHLNSIDVFQSNINSIPSKNSMGSNSVYRSHYLKESRTVGTSSSPRKSQSELNFKSIPSSRVTSKPFPNETVHTRTPYDMKYSLRNCFNKRSSKGRYRTRNRNMSKKSNKYGSKQQQKDNIALVSKQNKTEVAIKVKDFEEIKLSGDIKDSKLPVGFRRCKVKYLSCKKGSFFKPKLYYICPERTVIKSKNVKNSVVPDFITELESISEEENVIAPDFITELEPISEEENVPAPDTELEPISEEENVPDFITELESISEEEYEMETEAATEDKNQVTPRETEIEPVPESEIYSDIESEEELIIEEYMSGGRAYRKCIPDNPDFYQGETLIQSDIDVYKSHLIGLGYIVEIREKNDETNAIQHRCILCAADIHAENDSGEMVIAHVSSFGHMFKYLEKHFPSCGFNFSDSVENYSKKIMLEKICEEISSKLGYDCMSVTDDEYFAKENEHVVRLVNDIPHWCEADLSVNFNSYQNEVESNIEKSVSSCVLDTIKDISPQKVTQIQVEETGEKSTIPEQVCETGEKSTITEQVCETDEEKNKTKEVSEKDKGANEVSEIDNEIIEIKEVCEIDIETNKSKQISANDIKIKKPSKGNLTNKRNYRPRKGGPVSLFSLFDKPDKNQRNWMTRNKTMSSVSYYEDSDDVEILFESETKPKDSNVSSTAKVTGGAMVADHQSDSTVTEKTKISEHKNDQQRSSATNSLPSSSSNTASESSNSKVIDSASDSNKIAVISRAEKANKNVESGPDKWKSAVAHLEAIKSDSAQVLSSPSDKTKKSSTTDASSKSSRNQKVCSQSSAQAISTIITHSNSGRAGRISEFDLHQLSKDKGRTKTHSKYCIKRIISRSKIQKDSFEDNESSRDSTHSASISHRSRSPFKHRRSLKSPLKMSKVSPRRRSRSPVRRFRSPTWDHSISYRKRSRSPFKRQSRSPFRRQSRSPNKRYSRSPIKWHSRSPIRKHSRSPGRKYSRSPSRRYSRSPIRRHSRSPIRKYSRSPLRRRYSRSPIRERSRSAIRRHSKSPSRKHSRSPFRRYSRSPVRRYSKSPTGRQARGLPRRNSRSPMRKLSRSPFRTELRKKSRSPFPIRSYSPIEKNLMRHRSRSSERTKHTAIRTSYDSSNLLGSISKYPQKSTTSDLDPVSDEDESLYFNTMDKFQGFGDVSKLPESTRSVMSAMFKKFLATEGMKPGDSSLIKFMQFMDANSSDIPGLNSNLSTSVGETNLPNLQRVDAIPHLGSFQQPHLPPNVLGNPQFHSSSSLLPHPAVASNPNPVQSYYPPPSSAANFMSHAPTFMTNTQQPTFSQLSYPASNQPGIVQHNILPSSQPKITSELMFKDLKARVHKLFGADERPKELTPKEKLLGSLGSINTRQSSSGSGASQNFASQLQSLAATNFNATFSPKNKFPVSAVESNFRGLSENAPNREYAKNTGSDMLNTPPLSVPPPDAKVSFCEAPRSTFNRNLFPVVPNSGPSTNYNQQKPEKPAMSDVKKTLAQRLASVLVKVGMVDVPAPLLQEMLMKIGAFSSCPPQDITESEILAILKRLGYV